MHSETYLENEEYWEEPRQWTTQGLSFKTISTWLTAIDSQLSASNTSKSELPNTPTFADGPDTYRVTETAVDANTRSATLTTGFVLAAGGFAFYEEIIAALATHLNGIDSFLSDIANKRIKRRSFFKLMLGTAAIHQVNEWNQAYISTNPEAKARLQQEITETLGNMEIDDEQVIETLFGSDIHSIVATHREINSLLPQVLGIESNSIKNYDEISPLLLTIADSNTSRIETLAKYTNKDLKLEVPDELNVVASHLRADRSVQAVANTESRQATWNAIVEVLALIVAFTGIAITQEVSLAVTESVYKKFTDQ